MRDRASLDQTTAIDAMAVQDRNRSYSVWPVLAALMLIAAMAAVAARLAVGPRMDGLVMVTALAAAGVLCLHVPRKKDQGNGIFTGPDKSLKNILDSAGPMVISIGVDGCITHINPAAERLLGYHASELLNQPRTADVLAPGE